MERRRAELARGVERYMFRRVAAENSPLLDDHTREIIAEAIAWAVDHALTSHVAEELHFESARANAGGAALSRASAR